MPGSRIPELSFKMGITTVYKRLSESRGSTTIEASIIFPVIMFMLFGLVFCTMYVYHRLVVLDSVIYAAKERAVTWDNSSKDLETGSIRGSWANDGLYWRIFNDLPGSRLVTQKRSKALSLVCGRLKNGIFKLGGPDRIDVTYDNSIVNRTVSVGVSQNVLLPGRWLAGLLGPDIAAAAQSEVSEPVEFIRNFDLGVMYLNEFRACLNTLGQGGNGGSPRQSVVASVKSDVNGQKVYHFPGCVHIGKIKPENLKEFPSEDDANLSGFHLCLDCARKQLGQ